MTFATDLTKLGVSVNLILLISVAIWLGAPAYFLFKSDKNQKSAFHRDSPQENSDGETVDEVVLGQKVFHLAKIKQMNFV